MRNALLIHGTCGEEEYFSDIYPSLSNNHWFPWLQKQLLIREIFTQTPEMPDAYKPDYKKWKDEFERFEINNETILVGYSCGGGFLCRWLTENKINIAKLVLVAPWLDPEREKTTDFFDFTIDPGIQKRVGELHLLVSEDDEPEILKSVEIIRTALPKMKIHQFKDKGHFTLEDMGTDKFPELLEVVLSSK